MKHLVSWVSVPTVNFERAVKFYSDITGKKFLVMGEGDERMASPMSEEQHKEGIVGFGVTADPTIIAGKSGARLYIVADNMIELLGRVESAGGKILVQRSQMGDHGYWALLEDTEGNSIGLHSDK